MNEDPRCCGSGTCIIDAEGRCWCGQLWNGQKMCHAPLVQPEAQGISVSPAQGTCFRTAPAKLSHQN